MVPQDTNVVEVLVEDVISITDSICLWGREPVLRVVWSKGQPMAPKVTSMTGGTSLRGPPGCVNSEPKAREQVSLRLFAFGA